ncbi:MAG TPA: pyridoxal phosphate-dependent aminotransferase [Geobacterales bacterium]|nr:pyridoxal phosphate-dependent aminotransferase [Geobacterales bacterium]
MADYEAERIKKIIRMTMADIAELADSIPGSIRLENADSDYTVPKRIIDATKQAVGLDEFNSYLPLRGLKILRDAIAKRYKEDYGIEYDANNEIVVTSGAGEAILDVLLSYVNAGDRVLMTNPTYNGMVQRVKLAGGIPVFIELDEKNGWHIDLSTLDKLARSCKMIFFASSSLPTGTVFTYEETKALVEAAEDNDCLILFDGAMEKIVYDGNVVVNPASIGKAKERTICVSSVSKNYSMMGWRIGWAAGPAELIKNVENVHIFNGLMPSGITQAGAAEALAGDQRWLSDMLASFMRRRDILIDGLSSIPGLESVKPEGGYSFLANIRKLGIDSRKFCIDLLKKKKVATTPMIAWGRDDFGHEHVRFVFTNEREERLQQAVSLIAEFVKELK